MNYNKIFNKSFMMLFVSNFFIFIAFEMLLPVLPAYLNQMQASPLQIGLIVSLFTIGSVLIRPFIGYYMINHNVKMIVILITAMLLIVTISYPFFRNYCDFNGVTSIPWCIVGGLNDSQQYTSH